MPLKEIPSSELFIGHGLPEQPEWDGRLNFLGNEICFSDGSIWQLGKPYTRFKEDWKCNPPEGRVTLACDLIEQPRDSSKKYPDQAVMKIKIQLHTPPSDRASSRTYSSRTERELQALAQLTNERCESTPVLIVYETRMQAKEGFVKDRYICFIVMTRLPGEALSKWSFWTLSFSQRNEIREAFKKAFFAAVKAGIRPVGSRLENLIWDSNNGICYIVDFEDCNFRDGPNGWCPSTFADYKFVEWRLAESSGELEEPWG